MRDKIKVEDYVLDGTQAYCLYDNIDQDNLLSIASDLNQMKEETKYYSKGVWFEYDNVLDNNIILNERKYKKRIRFPKEPKIRPNHKEK